MEIAVLLILDFSFYRFIAKFNLAILKNTKMKVIITGSSGMIGKGVLLECLDSDKIDNVLVINRKSINTQHPKLNLDQLREQK